MGTSVVGAAGRALAAFCILVFYLLARRDGSLRVRATVSMGATLRLPGEWSLRWNSGFDAESGEFTNQQYVLTRSLHKWNLEFSRGVSGDGSDFGFRLYLSQIPDLEVKRGDRARGGGLERLNSF